jgi:hypothetical protein
MKKFLLEKIKLCYNVKVVKGGGSKNQKNTVIWFSVNYLAVRFPGTPAASSPGIRSPFSQATISGPETFIEVR